MRRELALLVLVLVALITLITPAARAADAGPADASPPAEVTPPPNPHGAGPTTDEPDDGHGEGMMRARDRSFEDARLPAGAAAVQILDADEQPVGNVDVTIGILKNTVAKGESKEHRTEKADAMGRVLFKDLQTGSGVSYRVSVSRNGGLFAASPFGLSADKGMAVLLHVYPTSTELMPLEEITSVKAMQSVRDKAIVLVEAILYVDLKDDRVQMQQVYRLVNAGNVAWIPKDVVLPVPAGFTSFVNDTQSMSDASIDNEAGRGLRIKGTFGPGQHELIFRWQLPYDGADKVTGELTMPPSTVSMRLMAAASEGMHLTGEGFPAAQLQPDGRGQRVLITERSVRRGEKLLSKISFALTDIPPTVPSLTRGVVVALAALVLLGGILLGARGPRAAAADDVKARRALLLADLEELVRAHRAGDIGPKTFERARRELFDAIARTLPVP